MSRFLVVLALAGCSLATTRRVSTGVTVSSDGAIGLAASAELGGGYVFTHSGGETARHGELATVFAGAGVSTAGRELDGGGRADYVRIDGDRVTRLGLRAGVLARPTAPLLVYEAALAYEHGATGIEVRFGPELAVLDGFALAGFRAYAGVTYEGLAVHGHVYDPIDALFGSRE
jgi:hypothetical protein